MNKLKRLLHSIFFLFFLLNTGLAQSGQSEEKILSLTDVIDLAKGQSPSSKLASTNYTSKFWQYRLYKSNYLPQVSLNATLPNLNRATNPITQPDGTVTFIPQSLLTNSMSLSVSQNIGLTNSQIFITSQLQRIDILNTPVSRSYLVSPILFGISQPIFGFNKLRWDNRIEPMKYEEAQKQFNEDLEQVSVQASELFFDLLTAQMELKIQQKNVSNSDTLYRISTGRYNLGKIAENELLQMELNLMKAKNSLAQAELDADVSMLKLANFLKLPSGQRITLLEPSVAPGFRVDEKIALAQAEKNSQAVIAFQRKRLEAERDVIKAIRDNRFSANVVASYGLSNDGSPYGLNSNPQSPTPGTTSDQQQVRLGLQVPIIDWGRAKAQIMTMEAIRQYVEISTEQDEQSLKQEILMLSKQFEMHRQKLFIAQKADTIAQKRFEISMKRYIIGKIAITDLNIALQEKDQAKVEYLNDLRQFWHTYYDIRRRTLYDFQNNAVINNK
jgi:outer membrane protein